jgi:proline dehydrogenase
MNVFNSAVVKMIPVIPRGIVRKFANPYIAGDKINDAVSKAKELNKMGIMGTMDVLGEHNTLKEQAIESTNECIGVLDAINNYKLDSNLSVKLTQLGLQMDFDFCRQNLFRILDTARKYNIFVRIDMEDSSCTDDTLKLYDLSRDYYPNCGIVIQAYLRRSYSDVEKLVKKKANFRLCKGIYVEPEEIAFKKKNEINQNFLKILRLMFESKAYVGIATHDDAVVDDAYKILDEFKLKKEEYEFQMLLGIKEKLRDEIHSRGHRMRIYIPFGEHWYSYCIRRFKENPKMATYVLKSILTGN